MVNGERSVVSNRLFSMRVMNNAIVKGKIIGSEKNSSLTTHRSLFLNKLVFCG
jgi:hypothetical protein